MVDEGLARVEGGEEARIEDLPPSDASLEALVKAGMTLTDQDVEKDFDAAPKTERKPRPYGSEIGMAHALFMELLKDPDFWCLTNERQAEELKISIPTLRAWKRKITKDEWARFRDQARQAFPKHAIEIDAALIAKAKKGDVKAIELFYQKYENWSIKQILETIHKNGDLVGLSDQDLMQKLLEGVPRSDLAKALKNKDEKTPENPIEAEIVPDSSGAIVENGEDTPNVPRE